MKTMTQKIINKYKDALKKISINAEIIIQYGLYSKSDLNRLDAIKLIIISDDLKDIDICKRLEILSLTATRVSDRIEAIGYTEKEIEQVGLLKGLALYNRGKSSIKPKKTVLANP